ncbi:MAG: ATP-binding cassette domain-containing protein [Candidatus Heimdallarchaeaceae archaeon]
MIELKNISVTVGNFHLKDVSFSLKENEVLVVLGPSGSGKTTLLKTILGIYKPYKGTIFYKSRDITYQPINKRKIAYVPQTPTLYPHMTVEENIEYGLKLNKIPKEQRETRIDEVLSFMEIEEHRQRLPKNLSGGEAHRVSIARALVLDFPLILLDEPLTGIDIRKGKEIRKLLKESVTTYDKTLIYVTHQIEEAAELASRIAVLNQGQVERIAKPEEIIIDPRSKFIADFFDFENILRGHIKHEGDKTFFIPANRSKNVEFFLSSGKKLTSKEEVTITIRPEDIILSETEITHTSARNCIEGKIVEVRDSLSSTLKVVIDCGVKLTAVITRFSKEELGVEEGKKMFAIFKATAVSLID